MFDRAKTLGPTLQNLIRHWIEGDPILSKHFTVYGFNNGFEVMTNCKEGPKNYVAYVFDDDYTLWYVSNGSIKISPAHPEFFKELEKAIIHRHNTMSDNLTTCRDKL